MITTRLETRFRNENPLERWATHRILVGVSGGADSTALLRLFCHFRREFGLKIYVAHANHQLRGEESDGDERFVRELCETLDVPLVTQALTIPRTSDGLENDARRARYEFLADTSAMFGCRYLALAHHRDDQVETIFHRILRGTGVAGLAGIVRLRPLNDAVTVVRPLLSFLRAEIVAYLTEKGQTWRTDSSNFCTDLTRNRIRQEVLPQLRKEFNAQLDTALLRLGVVAESMQRFVDAQTAYLVEHCVMRKSEGELWVRMPDNSEEFPFKSAFYETLGVEQRRFLWCEFFRQLWRCEHFPEQDMGQAQWTLLAEMVLSATPLIHVFPGGIRVQRQTDRIVIFLKGSSQKLP